MAPARLLLALLLFVIPEPVNGQGVTTAGLVGVVTGPDSVGIEGAVVDIENTSNGERRRTITGPRGRFFADYLTLGGPYMVTARSIGFHPAALGGAMLSLGERQRMDFTLVPMTIELASLEVMSTADALVNAGRTGPAQTIRDSVISRMPVRARDFAQLAYLSPQAVRSPVGGVSIAGQSDRLNGFQIDGATNLDLTGFAGGEGFGTPGAPSGVRTLSVEAIQELQILTAPFDVRYGTFAAGLVNAVTRSGSNRWEGSISAYFEDRQLTGKDSSGQRLDDFHTSELAFTLGGPIVRNRASFFVDIGLQRDVTPQATPAIGVDTTGGADSAGTGMTNASATRFQDILRTQYGQDAGSFAAAPERRPSGNLFAKLTLVPAVNQRIELSYNHARGNPRTPGFRSPYEYYGLSSNGEAKPGRINSVRATWTTSRARLANELNVAWLGVRERCRPASSFAEIVVRVDEGMLGAGETGLCGVNHSDQDIAELTDNLTLYRGNHQYTFGTHLELIRTERATVQQPAGHWEFTNLDSLAAAVPSSFRRSLVNPLQPGGPAANLGINQVGFYAQDQWAVSSRLTLTAGIRVDVPFLTSRPVRNPALQAALGIDNSRTPSGHPLWSPRLGFSWSLAHLGFVRGGIGYFAGRPAYHWLSSTYTSNGLNVLDLYCDSTDVPAFTLDPANQPTSCGSGSGPSAPASEVAYLSPAFRFPRNLRLSLGTDLRLGAGLVGTVDLLFIRSTNQYDVTDVNLQQAGVAAGEGGRILYGSIDGAGTATPSRRSAAFGPVVEVRNASGDRSFMATAQIQRRFSAGAEVSVAYTFTDSRDRMSAGGDLAAGNLGSTILDGSLDARRLAVSSYSVPHKISVAAFLDLPLRARFSLFYVGYSGEPFTYRVLGDVNADGVTSFGATQSNDAAYVPLDSTDISLSDPAQWASLNTFIESRSCLRAQRGRLVRRNSCRDPFRSLVNARVSKVFPTMRGQSFEVIVDVFNVLNLLNRDWGVSRTTSGISLLRLDGYDVAAQRGIYRFIPRDPRSRNTEATRWRIQLGGRYTF